MFNLLTHRRNDVSTGGQDRLFAPVVRPCFGQGISHAALMVLMLILLMPVSTLAVPPGTVISNMAQATYDLGSVSGIISPSNTVTIVTVDFSTPSTLEFLQYASTAPGAEFIMVSITDYSTSGTPAGPFVPLPPPTPLGSGVPIDLSNPVPLVVTSLFHQSEPVFVRLTDADQNLDPLAAETVVVTLSVGSLGEGELLRITETGPDAGVFVGYIQSAGNPPPATANDGTLSVVEGSDIGGDYVDVADANDSAASTAMVDPFGVVFDSTTGGPVDGATVTLIDTATGAPALVVGDDGVSSFPATITSGGTVTDSGGTVYNFPSGGYRFPLVSPGNYRLDVVPPTGYAAPSTVPTAILQSLPGGPFAIVDPGSRGEPFVLNPGPAFRIDIPIDPTASGLWLRKTASKDTVGVGDFLQYSLDLENFTGAELSGVIVRDRLPSGFRFESGSAKVDGVNSTNPGISSDGRTLTFNLGVLAESSTVNIRYVLEVGAGARLGEATNQAVAHNAGGITSNLANATVTVREHLFRSRSFIVGRVIADNCSDTKTEKNDGVEGVRIFLEDGTYVVTDEKGMFHFEGVRPGVHVVQLDLVSLPEQYEVVPCEKNSRFAGRAYSQFVDLQGGTMWRTDFHVALKPELKGEASLQLESSLQENTVGYKVQLKGRGVPLCNQRIMIMMPEGTAYIKGSSRLDDSPFPDPSLVDNVLTFRLGDASDKWTRRIEFKGSISSRYEGADLRTKAVLIFDTPTSSNQRTPLVEVALKRIGGNAKLLQQSIVSVETTGLRPGEKQEADKPKGEIRESMPSYDKSWLTAAKPGLEWLWPEPDYYPAIPSLKVAIKHHPGDKLTLLLNGGEVSILNFDGMIKNKAGTISVSRWTGVDLQEGNNHFELIAYDAKGKEIGRLQRTIHYSGSPAKAELIVEQSSLIADGRTPPVVAIRLTDKDGYPAREGVIGAFSVDPPYNSYQEIEVFKREPLSGLGREKPRYTVGKNGIALIKLQPTSKSGEVVLRFHFVDEDQKIREWLKPEKRDWILVGLAEGTVGYNTVTGNMESLDDAGVDEKYYDESRVAFFAKGRIKGKWLLTIAYDSAKRKREVGNSLFQTIDPDTFYTLYGDGTQQDYDAASAEKLYLKIERDQFYVLFGDYDTGLTVTELSRYNRSFTGLKSELQTQNFEFNLFASETDQAFGKDEIRGDGTSGLYRLSRKNIVINSEKVIIETRDRFRSEVIISSRSMSRHIDYNIDYEAGTLFFKEPVFSKDENFNPIFIVIDYETTDPSDDEYNYGGRAAVKLLDQKIEVGATYIHQGQGAGDGDLLGLDATIEISQNTQLKTEFASTKKEFFDDDTSGAAYLAELRHRSDKLDGTLYFREQEGDFGLGQQNGSESGTRKLGADATYRFNQRVSVNGQAYRQFNLSTDAERDLGETTVNYAGDSYGLRGGLRHAEDRLEDGTENASNQITAGASKQLFGNRLQLRADHEQSIGDSNDNPDFPTRTTLGADYKLADPVTLFAEHEFTQGENEDTQGTRVGLKATPWKGGQVGTSIERAYSENGERVFANMGLNQTWQVNEKWSLDGGLDHSRAVKDDGSASFNTNIPPASGGDNDFTAISLGTTYREEKWSWTCRGEYRNSDTEDKWGILSGIYGELREGLGLSAGIQIFRTEAKTGPDTTDGDIRLGLAYRPRNSRWIVLDRLDFIFEEEKSSDFDFDNWRIVNNLNANYKLNWKTQIAFQYGAKYVQDTIDGDQYSGFIDLVGIESRYDLTEKWDIGVRGSVLHSWNADQFDYSTGVSLGYNIVENAWISVGYNFLGFEDEDFSKGSFTAKGPFVQFRFKFDQGTGRDLLGWFHKK